MCRIPDIPEESNGHTSLLGGATKPKPGYGSMGEDGRDSEGEAGNRESNLIYGNVSNLPLNVLLTAKRVGHFEQ